MYHYSAGSWAFVTTLTPYYVETGGYFGYSPRINTNDDMIMIGAAYQNGSYAFVDVDIVCNILKVPRVGSMCMSCRVVRGTFNKS